MVRPNSPDPLVVVYEHPMRAFIRATIAVLILLCWRAGCRMVLSAGRTFRPRGIGLLWLPDRLAFRLVRTRFYGRMRPRQWVTITKQEHIDLTARANYWEAQHARVKAQLEELKQGNLLKEAKIKDLRNRLFGKKSEKNSPLQSEKHGQEDTDALGSLCESPRQGRYALVSVGGPFTLYGPDWLPLAGGYGRARSRRNSFCHRQLRVVPRSGAPFGGQVRREP
jgi:hypothetical protein